MYSAVLFDLDGTLVDRTSTLREFLPPFSRMLCPDSAEQQTDFVRRFHELDADGYGDKSVLFGTLCREFDLTADPVGDHPEKDVMGAARVGMTTVWVSHGAT